MVFCQTVIYNLIMDIKILSSRFIVRQLEKHDAQTVLDLYESNPLYFEHCPPPPTIQSVEYDMRALPDGKSIADKHFVGFFDGNKLVAVLDLIEKYPDKQTVFIGLFMVAAAYQGRGVGSKIVSSCFSVITVESAYRQLAAEGYTHVRLGYVKTNPQAKSFWQKLGLVPTGIECEQENYTVVVTDRII